MRAKVTKILLGILLTPIVLVLLLAVALYIPPIQQWAVNRACAYVSDEMGMDASIESVHLVFPLDLSLEGVKCTQQNTSTGLSTGSPQVTDTIIQAKKVIADVELLPLLDDSIKVKALELNQAHLNTADFIHTCRIKGYVGRLLIDKQMENGKWKTENGERSVATVALNSSIAKVSSVILDNAHLDIALSDTVPEDTTKEKTPWKFYIKNATISNSSLAIHMPGDKMQLTMALKDVKAEDGYIDLKQGQYDVSHCDIKKSGFAIDYNNTPRLKSGFDSNHIAFKEIDLNADSFHYLGPDTLLKRASELAIDIRKSSLKEQSGLVLKSLKGTVNVNSKNFAFNGSLATPSSSMILDLRMNPNVIDSLDVNKGIIDAKIDASIGRTDLMTFAFNSMSESLRRSWPMYPLAIKGELHGNMSEVSIPWLTVTLLTAFSADLHGNARGFMALAKNIYSRKFSAKMHGDIHTYNLAFVKSLLDRSTAKKINIPSMHAICDLTANGPEYDVSLRATENRASIAAKARLNAISKNYYAAVKAHGLNVGHFLKGYSNYNNINANLVAHNGNVQGVVDMNNSLIQGRIAAKGTVGTKLNDIVLSADIKKIDLYRMKLVDSPLITTLRGRFDFASDLNQYYRIKGSVTDITMQDTVKTRHPDNIYLDILTRRDTTAAMVNCGDFAMKLNAQGGYRWLMGCTNRMEKVLTRHFYERTINQDDIRKALPCMTVSLHSGQHNPVYRLMQYFGVDFKNVDLSLNTSYEKGIFADLTLDSLSLRQSSGTTTKGYKFDNITAKVTSTNVDSMGQPNKEIFYEAHINTSTGSATDSEQGFEAFLDGKVLQHGVSLNTKLYDDKDKLAVMLGAEATMEERGIKLHLTPDKPVLGYETFDLNDDNYVLLAHNNRIHANVGLTASDGTGLKIYCSDENTSTSSEQASNENTSTSSATDDYLQDLTLSVNKLDLGKVTGSLPFAPKIDGKLNGDFHFMEDATGAFTLSSDMTVSDMFYEGCKVGNLGTQFTYLPKSDGSHYIDGIVMKDDKEVGSINGSYNFNTEAIDATIRFDQFPLATANGFIPDQIIGFDGTAEGDLTIKGFASEPIVDGELYLQDAALLSVPYNIRLRFDDDPVAITNSKLLLENFQMYDQNNVPLIIYGNVNFANLDHINLDMKTRAKDFQLINSKENLQSTTYGNVYVNAAAFLKGDLDKLKLRGKLEILSKTNLFYILNDSPVSPDNTVKDLVTFTNLSQKSKVKVHRPQIDGMDMMLNVVCDEGAHIKAWLDNSHNNYIDLIGNGNLRLTYKNAKIGMTGKYTVSEGEMKYSLPIIPLKTFTIHEGSNLEWTGEITNPHLDLTATETIKAPVYVNDVTQMVTFNTGVKLSKTVEDMGLQFIIEAPENKTVSDELSMRSAEERGKLAVTMLTTGMYLTDGNTSNFSMNSALNSFLQSQINAVAGNALKTVDLSFGLESSTELDGTRHNDYTFKFAKRFWDNRLAISVGGKVSSGPDVSGQNKSFFNNVDLQYRLSDASNRYLQMFYKRNVYDYLEGYLSEFGAGYLWKKNTQTFGDIFRKTKNTQEMPPPRPEKKDTLVRFVSPTNEKK